MADVIDHKYICEVPTHIEDPENPEPIVKQKKYFWDKDRHFHSSHRVKAAISPDVVKKYVALPMSLVYGYTFVGVVSLFFFVLLS